MWFLICDEEYAAFGDTPREAYAAFMSSYGEYHYRLPRYFKGEEKRVKVEVTVAED